MQTTIKRPKAIEPKFNNIPDEMKELKQWALWRYVWNDKNNEWKKPPHQVNGKYANPTNPETWATFEEVRSAYNKGNYDGIGFILTEDDPYVGGDLDDKKGTGKYVQNNQIISGIAQVLSKITYTELSPSGRGVHSIFKGKLPNNILNKNAREDMEIYEKNRFLTFTGEIRGERNILEDQNVIDQMAERYFKKEKPIPTTISRQASSVGDIDNDNLLKIMFRSKNGNKIQALWDGDISTHYNDHSSADLALCSYLSFYTNKDAQRIDELFRLSGLYRPKWDERRGKKTYGEMTIQEAISGTHNTYYSSSIPKKQESHNEMKEEVKGYFDGKTFIPKRLADEILAELPTLYDGSYLYVYQNGVYKRDGYNLIGKMALDKLGEDFRSNRLSEIKTYIENSQRIIPDDFMKNEQFINVKNGLLDWKTGDLYPHTPNFFSNVQLPIEYDPSKKLNEIGNFFESVAPSDTLEMIGEWFGYSMLPTTKYEKAVMLTGEGSNGKSKFIELYEHFIGKENISTVPLQDLEQNRFKSAQLYGRLANVFADLPPTKLDKSSIFKTVVSGDRISAEFKGKDSFDFKPFAKLMFSANELPRSADLTDGFFRRWLIIPFPYKFGPGGKKADPNIMDKLTTEDELSGLLNFAIEGLKRLEQQKHFTPNETTEQAIEEYKKEIDTVNTFIEECCVVQETASVSKQELYSTYDSWCFHSGYKALGKIKFYKRIQAKIPVTVIRATAKSPQRFKGIGVLERF